MAAEIHYETLDIIADDVPVVMVNLMNFKERSDDGDGTGWDAYLRYSKAVSPMIQTVGGRIIWAGGCFGPSFGPVEYGDWHYVALVYYPNKKAFIDFVGSDEYQEPNKHRENGCERHVILATEQKYGRFNTRTE